MEYISYYHGFPLSLKGWLSCYSNNLIGWIEAFGAYAYHNILFWIHWINLLSADEIIFISETRMHQFFQRSKFLTKICCEHKLSF